MIGLIYSLLYNFSFVTLIPIALIAVCVIHAVRTNRIFPWIYVIVFLPGLGSLIYFFMEMLPDLMGSYRVRRAGQGLVRAIDQGRDYRQALRAADLVGSVDSKRELAEQYAARGQMGEAVALYKDIIQGQFADDAKLLMGLARAQFLGGDGAGAQATLEHLFATNPKLINEDAHMIYARSLEQQGKLDDAAAEYARLVPYFAGEEARVRYAAVLARLGRAGEARALNTQVVKNLTGAPRRYRYEQREWGAMARAALK
ncbi:MAG TPA: tetratricopeptide repeat protein [Rhizomicrobium sp.]|nr:tetratricopeptide repeat protein [Rhizomicrobium sp.]